MKILLHGCIRCLSCFGGGERIWRKNIWDDYHDVQQIEKIRVPGNKLGPAVCISIMPSMLMVSPLITMYFCNRPVVRVQ